MTSQTRPPILPTIPRLIQSCRDVLADAFGQRGEKAEITWTRIVLQEQGLDSSGQLFALNGTLRIDFILPHLPVPDYPYAEPDDGEWHEPPF